MSEEKIHLVKHAMLAVQRYPWEQGVCMQAVYELGDVKTAVAMAHDAVLRQTADGRLAVITDNIAVTDPAANGEVVLRAGEITGDPFYTEGAERMLDYLLRLAPRTSGPAQAGCGDEAADTEGILCHNEISFHEGYSPMQIWADSIYMAPPFLAVMGAWEEAVRQIRGMRAFLLDEESGLLRHIYDAGTGRFVRDKLWATGNGWALLGMARVIDVLRGITPMRKGVENSSAPDTSKEANRAAAAEEMTGWFYALLDHMLEWQLPDGRFHDILDDPASFVDGTSAMMLACAVFRAVRAGWLPERYLPYARKVCDTMEDYVDEYGILHGVCGCPDFLQEGTSAESMAAYLLMQAWKM
ncbi:MAG: glycoside hydrolase family 88 protein [Lachnospiraceae bacterium]|nr:glycoside hydrolase family 88 protein [Lachnospiraceae bacterium]